MQPDLNKMDNLFRIGAVSKLTEIPVSTIRIWEVRYGAFSPVKSSGNHRVYMASDLAKAFLLKELTKQGHSIGSIAHLTNDELTDLSQQVKNASLVSSNDFLGVKPVSIAVVGLGLAARIESKKLTLSFRRTQITLSHVFGDLTEAAATVLDAKTQILLVKANSLQVNVRDEISALSKRLGSVKTIVIYNYAPDALVGAMKMAGMLVRRDPISDAELSDLIGSVILADPSISVKEDAESRTIPPRKYSDKTLARMSEISTNVLCECPRHVAELITQLSSFEDYSQECLNTSDKDAQLHAALKSISGSARALFERALEMVALHEGIELDTQDL
jgi:MerR family transcriptional regulator, light-induced transcriptional regulator